MLKSQIYQRKDGLRERCRKIPGGIRVAALEAGMAPSTLSNKLCGWTPLYPEEERRIEGVLQRYESKIVGQQAA